MRKSIIVGVLLMLLSAPIFTSLNVMPAKASGTIYIRADGTIEPLDAPISTFDNVTYTLTGNIKYLYYDGIIVERNNIVVEGAGFAVEGIGVASGSSGIFLGASNVTIQNTNIKNFSHGIVLSSSSNNSIRGNNLTGNNIGTLLGSSSNNSISGNNLTGNDYLGIWVDSSSGNNISGNTIKDSRRGISLRFSSSNTISGNTFLDDGLEVQASFRNVVVDNVVNGKPLVYFEDVLDKVVEYAGQVILINCNRITVQNLDLSRASIGVELWQTNNVKISGNNITGNKFRGVCLGSSSNNSITGNNIAGNNGGIWLGSSSNNSITGNNITDNNSGIFLESSELHYYSNNNSIYHNNFANNTQHANSVESSNIWDDGYPDGGNYWSDYEGADLHRGLFQNETGKDWMGDTPYVISSDNQDRYPLMKRWPLPHKDLSTLCILPVSMQLGNSLLLNATVTNEGLNDEVNVELMFLVNRTTVNSTTIPSLQTGNSYTLGYLWTPTIAGTYNITAYARPVSEETSVENNQITIFMSVEASFPGVQVGVKTGDWIKSDYTIAGAPSWTPLPQWLMVEFLGVEGTNATVRVTMHMSDGTEQDATVPVDVVAGGEAFGLSGFVIPPNLTTGDSVYLSGYGNVTIAGETTRSYAGASRTVVHTSFSQYGTQLTYYWDKQTGAMVEASTTSGSMTATGKATQTNMWQAQPTGLPIDPPVLYAIIMAVGVTVAVLAFFVMHRKKKPIEVQARETQTNE